MLSLPAVHPEFHLLRTLYAIEPHVESCVAANQRIHIIYRYDYLSKVHERQAVFKGSDGKPIFHPTSQPPCRLSHQQIDPNRSASIQDQPNSIQAAKKQKNTLLQTPGIEPGTFCAANRAIVATNC